jgi:hypothetical protein
MGVVCMKHRYHGSREGKRTSLGVQRGAVFDLDEKDRYKTGYGGNL